MLIFLFTGEVLLNKQREFQSKLYAPNSITTRGVQVKKYMEFISEFSAMHLPIPCPSKKVALYVTWLMCSLRYSCILNYLGRLNNFLKQQSSPTIKYDDYMVFSTL